MGSFCALPSAFLIFGLRLRRSHTKRPLRCEVSPKAPVTLVERFFQGCRTLNHPRS